MNVRVARFNRSFLVTALAAAICCSSQVRAADSAELLKLVPSDAWGFAVIKSFNALDDKAKVMKDALSLPFPTPVTPMALGMLNLGDTIDTSSPIVAIELNVQKFGGPDAAAVVIVPAKDTKALLEKLAATDAEDGVSKCTLMGEPAFAAVKGKRVLVGPNKDAVLKVLKAKKSMGDGVSDPRLKAMDKSDIYVGISLGAVVSAYKDQFMPIAQMMMAASDPSGKNLQQMVKMFEEMSSLDFALAIDEKGIDLSFLVQAKEASDLEKAYVQSKNADESILKLLPKEKFLAAVGIRVNYTEAAEKLSGGTGMISNMIKMSKSEDTDPKAAEEMDEILKKILRALKKLAVSVSSLDGGEGMIGLAVVVETDDAKDMVENVRKFYKAGWSLSKNEHAKAAQKGFTHTADGETIGGGKVDTIKISVKDLHEGMGAKAAEKTAQVEKIVGADCTLRFGAVDAKHFVLSFGGGKKRFETISAGAKSSGDSIASDTGVTEISGLLPKPRNAEMYFAVDHIFQTIKAITKATGEDDQFPFDMPEMNAPLAFTTTIQDKVQRSDIYCPMKLIKGLKSVYDAYSKAGDKDFDEDDDAGAKPAKGGKAAGGKKTGGQKAGGKMDKDDDGDKDEGAKKPAAPKAGGKKPGGKKPPTKPKDDDDDDK